MAGLVYHFVDHALFETLLFLCAGAIVHATGKTHLSEMGGLARRRPVLTGAFVVGALAIAGVPPLNGYVSLGLVHGAVESGHAVLLVALSAACLAFGAAPTVVLETVVGPAAASLTHGPAYAAATLSGGGRLAAVQVGFRYLDPVHLLVAAGTLAAGLLAAWWVVRRPDPRALRWLRALHTGSVNDYAAYAVLGAAASVLVLALA